MYRSCRSAVVVPSLILIAACAKHTTNGFESVGAVPVGGAAGGAKLHRNPYVIVTEELQDPTIASRDALTAIRQLRPAFFNSRGPRSLRKSAAGQLQITQDYGPLQPWNALSGIDTRSLVEVRYLDAVEATSRFGINTNGGPVLVLLSSRD